MEGCGQNLALTDQHRITADRGQNFHPFPGTNNFRRSNEHHLQWLLPQLALGFANRTVNLAAVGVAADTDVHYVQRFLRGILYMLSQQDGTGTGAERWLRRNEIAQLFQKAAFGQKVQKRARLSAGNYNAINGIKLFRLAHQHDLGAKLLQPRLVGFVVTLDGQHADFHVFLFRAKRGSPAILLTLEERSVATLSWCKYLASRVVVAIGFPRFARDIEKTYQPLVCNKSPSAMAATASPFMAPTRSSLTSSNTLGSSKCVQARTIAFARFSASLGSQKFRPSAMNIPEPTNTASAPSWRTSAASAGVAIPPAEKFGTGSLPSFATSRTSSTGACKSLA